MQYSALAESNHPTRWYPFSVTGINITGYGSHCNLKPWDKALSNVTLRVYFRFMIELVRDRLVDFKLYSKAKDEAAREDNVEQGVLALHELYCTLFTRFNKLWVDSNPRDVMAFPTIFQSLKDSVRRELTQRSFKY